VKVVMNFRVPYNVGQFLNAERLAASEGLSSKELVIFTSFFLKVLLFLIIVSISCKSSKPSKSTCITLSV
jgi:hypothetical protein